MSHCMTSSSLQLGFHTHLRNWKGVDGKCPWTILEPPGCVEEVERRMTATANYVLRAGSVACVQVGGFAGGSEVQKSSLAEYLPACKTLASLLYPLCQLQALFDAWHHYLDGWLSSMIVARSPHPFLAKLRKRFDRIHCNPTPKLLALGGLHLSDKRPTG
jgi:hypothetical protein